MSSPARKSGRQPKPTEKLKEFLHEYEEKPKKESKAPILKAVNTETSKESPLNSNIISQTIIKKRGMFDIQMSSPARKSGREVKPTEKLKEYLHDYEMPIKLSNRSTIDGHNQLLNDSILKPVTTIQTVAKKRGRPSKTESDSDDHDNVTNSKKFKKGKENDIKKATFQYPCGVCGSEVRNSSVWCTGCLKWCHKRCSGLKSLTKVVGNFKCPTCLRENMNNTMVTMPRKEKKTKSIPDTKIYVVPKGWRRQAVKRQGGIRAGKFDVFYYSPQGKKLRSFREVENFCLEQGIEIDLSQISFNHSEKGRLSLKNAGLPIIPMKIITSKSPKDVEAIKETRGRPRGSIKSKKEVVGDGVSTSKKDQSSGKLEFMEKLNITISSPDKKDKTEAQKELRGRPRGSAKFHKEEADNGIDNTKEDRSPGKLVDPKSFMNGDTSPQSSPGLRKLRLVDNQNKSKHSAKTNPGIKDEEHGTSKNVLNSVEEVSVSPSVMSSPVTKSGRQVKPTEKLKESTIPINHANNKLNPGAVTYASMIKFGTANKQTKHPNSILAVKGYKQVVRSLSKNNEENPNWDLALARMTEVYSWVNTAPEEMKKKVHELTLRFFSCIEILQSKHRTSLPTQELINV